jgi:hypothetical protein
MKRSSILGLCVAAVFAAAQLTDTASAQSGSSQHNGNDHGNHGDRGRGNAPVSVTVSFGAGLNTAQPGNPVNHHILPRVIDVKSGGVVNFVVAGFHQVFVYDRGTKPSDIEGPVAGSFFINDIDDLYYRGIVPAGGPPPGLPITTNPSNADNRVESVAFFEPGVYLVICNVRPHFNDGMWAFVRVVK